MKGLGPKFKFKEDDSAGKILKILCSDCKIETNHRVIHNHRINGEEDYDAGFSVSWMDDYQIIKCGGCDSVSFKHDFWFSEDHDPRDANGGMKTTLYPPRVEDDHKIQNFRFLPKNLNRIYRETVDCFNAESYTLAAAGLRALVEGICAEVKIDSGLVGEGETIRKKNNLEGKINGLSEKGYLTDKDAKALHDHRFLGNKAIHEFRLPSPEELLLAIQIIEHTLKSVFEIPKMHGELKSEIKKRKRRKAES